MHSVYNRAKNKEQRQKTRNHDKNLDSFVIDKMVNEKIIN